MVANLDEADQQQGFETAQEEFGVEMAATMAAVECEVNESREAEYNHQMSPMDDEEQSEAEERKSSRCHMALAVAVD